MDQPKWLYHYTTLHGLLGILKTGVIWLTDVRYLNDTTELQLLLSALPVHLEQIDLRHFRYRTTQFDDDGASPNGVRAIESDSFATLVLDTVTATINSFRFLGVASFSANHDLLSQWRAYANNQQGIALEFDRTLLASISTRRNRTNAGGSPGST